MYKLHSLPFCNGIFKHVTQVIRQTLRAAEPVSLLYIFSMETWDRKLMLRFCYQSTFVFLLNIHHISFTCGTAGIIRDPF